MNVNGAPMQTIEFNKAQPEQFTVIDQRHLPHQLKFLNVDSVDKACMTIKDMVIRGAPLIGVTAAFGMVLAALESRKAPSYIESIEASAEKIKATRPTAVNLAWAVDEQMEIVRQSTSVDDAIQLTIDKAISIKHEDVEMCRQIGVHGVQLIEKIYAQKKQPVNILTHCNAGWLACVDWGTATSPMYHAHEANLPIHVWVDETRPRNQGAKLTAWELGQHGIPHTLIVDNAGGHLMQHGMVDIIIVGSDRTTSSGDVANKIGTYLKALAAKDNNIPFYAALPSSTIDWSIDDGVAEIPIEERDQAEVRIMDGKEGDSIHNILICPESTPASNYGFDVTPARLVSGIITERGVCEASKEGLARLFPEKK